MILKELTTDHYVVVDDSEIKQGDWMYLLQGDTPSTKQGEIARCEFPDANNLGVTWKKITHSTQPFNCNCSNRGYRLNTNCAERNHCFDKIQYLSLQEVKELIGEVDILQKFKEIDGSCQKGEYEHWLFESGYNQALEDNKEKKYTEEDMKYMFECGRNYQNNAEITFKVSIDYLQPKTEWEVTFDEQGKLRLV